MQIVLPRTTLEQRLPLYEDIETLLDFGFLAHRVRVNGSTLAFRTLGPGDLFLLKYRVSSDSDNEWKNWMTACSLWMVDGQNLLGSHEALPRFYKTVRGLPAHVREILFSIVLGLFKRQSKAIDATEAYCFEGISRYKWKSFGNHLPSGHSGIPGVEKLGSNHVQRMWSFYNSLEDQRAAEESAWEGFKLATSPHAPKGVKKIDDRDREVRQMELDRRQEIQDRTYYIRKGLLAPPSKDGKKGSAAGGPAKTADDLSEEMRRWVAGEEDAHDKVVSAYKQRIVESYEQTKREMEEQAAMLREIQKEEEGKPVALVGYTPEQLAEILKDRNPGAAGVRQVGAGMNTVREYLYTKYLERSPDAGNLTIENGEIQIAAEVSLEDRISQRRVSLDMVSDKG